MERGWLATLDIDETTLEEATAGMADDVVGRSLLSAAPSWSLSVSSENSEPESCGGMLV
jgi:hypothetical protein